MGSYSMHSAVIHNDDLPRVHYGFDFVGNHNYSFARSEFLNCLLKHPFIFWINAGSCFIQENDRSIFQNGSGYGDPLLFTSR